MLSTALRAKTRFLAVEFDHSAASVAEEREQVRLGLPLPVLGGSPADALFEQAVYVGEQHGFSLYALGDLLIGSAVVPFLAAPGEATLELYRRLLRASSGRTLYRIWNYVPAINAQGVEGENYHAFCAGRSQAFEAAYGPRFKQALPSASAVGCHGDQLAVLFVAGVAAPKQIENPEQVPAYEYPREHGPRPPSFSRATMAQNEGNRLVFISGTAAIKGHITVAAGELQPQLDCTLHNLNIVSQAAGLGDNLAVAVATARFFKVYIRHQADFAAVRTRLERDLLQPTDHVTYLQADICRAALNVEIEATLLG
jgi:chorismate lyase / 3-hydroxybenzoate synthase